MTLPYAPRVAKLTITTTISGPRNKGINHNIAGPSSSSPARRLSLVPAAACPCDEDISGSIPSSYQTGETLIRCGRTAGVVVPPVRLYRRCGRTARLGGSGKQNRVARLPPHRDLGAGSE